MKTDNLGSFAILLVRVTVGVIFFAHGLQKLGAFGGSGIEGFSGMLKELSFASPILWAWIVVAVETLGGLFLILGILPRINAALIAVVMAVAIAKIHWAKGFFAMQGGFEYPLLILATCLSLAITGGGKFSLYDKF